MKAYILLGLLGILIIAGFTLAQSNEGIFVNPSSTNVNLGDDFIITVDINTTQGVAGVEFVLHYNSSILTTNAGNVTKGDFLGGSTLDVINVNDAAGKIEFSSMRYNPVSNISGYGTLLTIKFFTKSAGLDNLEILNVEILDENMGDVVLSVTDGIVKVNLPPSASNLAISPTLPVTTDDLTSLYNYSDPDGDPEAESEIRWYLSGVLQSDYNDLKTVLSSATTKDQEWYFTVRPSDGIIFGTLQISPTVTIGNTPPTPPVVDVTPDSPVTTNDLICTVTIASIDADDDSIMYIYKWYKNGVLQPALTTSTVDSIHTSKGEVWRCNVTASDGTAESPIASDQVTIQNLAPTVPVVDVTPNLPVTTDNLVCIITTTSTDADGDLIIYLYAWYKNGVVQSGLTTNTAAASYTSKGEVWRCVVTPNDGEADGPSAQDEVTIQNSVPVLRAIGDQNTDEMVNLIFSIIAYDLDNDVLTISATNLPNDAMLIDCPWPCAIPYPYKICVCKQFNWTPTYLQADVYHVTFNVSDGDGSDSEEITITVNNTNRPPSIDSYSPLAAVLNTRTGRALSFTHTSSDLDLDDILTYSWKIYGIEKATTQDWVYSPMYCWNYEVVSLTVSDSYDWVFQSWTINVELSGDVDLNGDVDIFDLTAVGLAYGSRPQDNNWNGNADLYPLTTEGSPEGDDVINVFDFATVGLNYGKSC